MTVVLLAAIVALAFTVEASLGFGATVVTVALGALILPIDRILPAYVPLNMALSAWLVARHHRHVDWRLLLGRIAPFMTLGIPLGMLALATVEPALLVRCFGAFVLALSGWELLRPRAAVEPPLRAWLAAPALAAGGVIHGAFGTGGPLVVWVAGRSLPDKAAFRATLAALWLFVNGLLVAGYAWTGSLDAQAVRLGAGLAPGLVVGLLAGEWLHRRVPAGAFRAAVFAMLAGVGALLALRG